MEKKPVRLLFSICIGEGTGQYTGKAERPISRQRRI